MLQHGRQVVCHDGSGYLPTESSVKQYKHSYQLSGALHSAEPQGPECFWLTIPTYLTQFSYTEKLLKSLWQRDTKRRRPLPTTRRPSPTADRVTTAPRDGQQFTTQSYPIPITAEVSPPEWPAGSCSRNWPVRANQPRKLTARHHLNLWWTSSIVHMVPKVSVNPLTLLPTAKFG